MDKFVARAEKEILNWPAMDIEQKPLDSEYSHKSGNTLEFKLPYNPYLTFEKGRLFWQCNYGYVEEHKWKYSLEKNICIFIQNLR